MKPTASRDVRRLRARRAAVLEVRVRGGGEEGGGGGGSGGEEGGEESGGEERGGGEVEERKAEEKKVEERGGKGELKRQTEHDMSHFAVPDMSINKHTHTHLDHVFG